MGTHHNRATGLHGNENLVDSGRRRVRGRHHRGDDAERLRDLDHPFVFVAGDDADCLHRPNELVDVLRGEEIFLDLVGDDAVAGFFDGEARERLGLLCGCCGHRVHDGVDLVLGEFRQLEPRLLGALRQRSCFRNRGEVAIGLGGRTGFCHR